MQCRGIFEQLVDAVDRQQKEAERLQNPVYRPFIQNSYHNTPVQACPPRRNTPAHLSIGQGHSLYHFIPPQTVPNCTLKNAPPSSNTLLHCEVAAACRKTVTKRGFKSMPPPSIDAAWPVPTLALPSALPTTTNETDCPTLGTALNDRDVCHPST